MASILCTTLPTAPSAGEHALLSVAAHRLAERLLGASSSLWATLALVSLLPRPRRKFQAILREARGVEFLKVAVAGLLAGWWWRLLWAS